MICAVLSPVKSVKVNACYDPNASHIHDSNCYVGTFHGAHTAECYTEREVRKYCSGRYEYDGSASVRVTEYTKFYYCTNKNCRYYYDRDYTNCVDFFTFISGPQGNWYPSDYRDSYTCPECGRQCGNRSVKEDSYYVYVNRLRCTGCGATAWAPCYSGYGPDPSYTVHGYHSVTEKVLTCTKNVGSYYDEKGNLAGCMCDRIVKTMAAEEPEQILHLGDPVNSNAFLSLYNGLGVNGYACEVLGYDPYDLGDEWQDVTLRVYQKDFPFSMAGNSRISDPACVNIKVKVIDQAFDIITEKNPRGVIVVTNEKGEAVERASEGEKIGILVSPYYGYKVQSIKIDGKNVAAEKGTVITEFVMPGHSIGIRAIYERDPKQNTGGGENGGEQNDEGVTFLEFEEEIGYRLPNSLRGFRFDRESFWRFEEEEGNGTGRALAPGTVLRTVEDLFLYGRWEKDDSLKTESILRADIITLNNDPVHSRDEEGTPFSFAGNRVGLETDLSIDDSFEGPFSLSLIPEYFLENEEGEEQKVRVLSTGRVGEEFITFYERGKDVKDELRTCFEERDMRIVIHWVLPHLSFAVKEENYAEFESYAEINTLSGEENFFERGCLLKVIFIVSVKDGEEKEILSEEVPLWVRMM
ncbi:MAG: hypothetical protein K6G60_09650 [Lachnospiraceae bacterium]|nr:hypothetical protein [Lachnospiraceae bacterium]